MIFKNSTVLQTPVDVWLFLATLNLLVRGRFALRSSQLSTRPEYASSGLSTPSGDCDLNSTSTISGLTSRPYDVANAEHKAARARASEREPRLREPRPRLDTRLTAAAALGPRRPLTPVLRLGAKACVCMRLRGRKGSSALAYPRLNTAPLQHPLLALRHTGLLPEGHRDSA